MGVVPRGPVLLFVLIILEDIVGPENGSPSLIDILLLLN